MKKVIIVIISLFFIGQIHAQEKYGMSSDPGSGVNGIFLNPAFSSRYHLDWHINLVSFHLFAENDYAHVSNSNLISTLANINNIDVVTRRNQVNENNSSRQLIFDAEGRKSLSVVSSVTWPSAIWKKNDKEKVGFFVQSRGLGSGFRIPEQLGYYDISEVRDTTVVVPSFGVSAGSWTDLGVHYSKVLNSDPYESTAVGINARLVLPHESGRFFLENNVDYSRFRDTFSTEGLITDSGYNYFTTGTTSYSPRINGIGLAVDIGYHFTTPDYSYGISLLDLGFAHVSGNAETFKIISDTVAVFDASQVIDPDDIIGIVEEVDRQLEPQVSRVVEEGGSFTMGMPTAISLQYARPLSRQVSLSANLVQRIPLFRKGLRRPNSLAVVPTYRSGLLAVSMPASLYEYKDLRIGLSVSYWIFYMGSDHLTSLFGSRNFSGTDIYFGFQLYPFDKAAKKKGVECFKF